MTTTVQAIYEDEGILRLLSPLELEKGAQVEVTVNSNQTAEMTLAELERNAPDPRRAFELIAEIAKLAVSHGEPDYGGRDHDLILYGGPDGAR